jgi:hypothetical protein
MGSIIIAITIVILVILYLSDKNRKPSPRKYYWIPPKRRTSRTDYEPSPISYPRTKSKESSKDYIYLIKLLNGDEEGANRLMSSIQKKNPDKNQQWVIEKAVSDILRDRT